MHTVCQQAILRYDGHITITRFGLGKLVCIHLNQTVHSCSGHRTSTRLMMTILAQMNWQDLLTSHCSTSIFEETLVQMCHSLFFVFLIRM